MNNWKKCKLGDICSKITDGSHKSPPSQTSGFPMASVKDMEYNQINLNTCRKISKEDYLELVASGCQPEINDILIAKDGSYLKHVFRVRTKEELVLLSSIAIIRPILEQVCPQFLTYVFKNKRFIEEIEANYVTGAVIPRIVLRDFKEIEITLPPLEEQRQIAAILSSIDDKIELLHEQNKTLEKLAQTLFRHYFIENPNPSWQEKSLKDVCVILNGYAFKSKEYSQNGTKIVRTTNFKNGFIDNKDVIYIDNLENQYDKYLLRKNDFLLVMVGASLGNYVVVTSNVLPALQNQNMWNFRALEGVSQHYLNYALRDIVKESVYGASGSAREFFQKNQFYEKNILVPSFEIMNKFEEEISGFYDKLNENLEQIQTLENMRDILIPKLLNGEIKINN
ncbi:restriction endonuclease subunit S [Campylobacter sp. 2018MI13]|uniref:restriction endonuclease subunit S n=1 Tax=Campylobacter sp. 2018MI13 TaxID=2836737 RepID=UPI001BDB0E15|nr:restriction endonuclease subunit S [Campylobacter sp. 2018MI13]MBT0882132.1 restriction endonuclease subunit S [Campylobacter sp. 2018MI13]